MAQEIFSNIFINYFHSLYSDVKAYLIEDCLIYESIQKI